MIPGEWDPRSLRDPRDRPEQGDCGCENDEGTDDDEGKVHHMMVKIVADEDNNEKPVEENGKMSAESRDPSVGDNLARSYQDLGS